MSRGDRFRGTPKNPQHLHYGSFYHYRGSGSEEQGGGGVVHRSVLGREINKYFALLIRRRGRWGGGVPQSTGLNTFRSWQLFGGPQEEGGGGSRQKFLAQNLGGGLPLLITPNTHHHHFNISIDFY